MTEPTDADFSRRSRARARPPDDREIAVNSSLDDARREGRKSAVWFAGAIIVGNSVLGAVGGDFWSWVKQLMAWIWNNLHIRVWWGS